MRIDEGALVVVHCRAPKEKIWGLLLRLDTAGVTVRGFDINSVEDWLRQEIRGAEPVIGPSTVFLPTHRLERISLDESTGAVRSVADRFREACGRDVCEALVAQR